MQLLLAFSTFGFVAIAFNSVEHVIVYISLLGEMNHLLMKAGLLEEFLTPVSLSCVINAASSRNRVECAATHKMDALIAAKYLSR